MIHDDGSSSDTSSDTSSDSSIGDAGASDYPSSDATSSDTGSSDTASSDGQSSDGASSDGTSSSAAAANAGWSNAVSGGWNSGERTVGGVRRIPLDGLKNVNQDPAPSTNTNESAAGRAILVVPTSLDASQAIDVLLHLHGFNIGYRQRVASSSPDAGTVRDVLVDQIEDQLGRSGRSMIAVPPRGH